MISVGFRACDLPVQAGSSAAAVEAPCADLGRLADTVLSGIDDRGSAVAIYPDWAAEPGHRNLQTVRSALATDRLALQPTSLPPLAAAVFASLVSALARRVSSPGALLALVPGVESRLLWATWLGSVSRLVAPPPTLGQHLASHLPRSAFAVCSWSSPPLRRLRRGRDGISRPPVGSMRMGLVVAGENGDADWVHRVVVPAMGAPAVTAVQPSDLTFRRWGTTKVVEAVAHPLDVDELLAGLPAWRRTPCRWCGQEIGGRPCPFCWMTEPGTDAAAAGA
ncbi:MAG TPA: hypothetical protein VG455_08860 [Acidimicrobiales bacterium]|nr:hypothetical protein [Acidimicrobiales bacterium]